jgi:hypothetical protein
MCFFALVGFRAGAFSKKSASCPDGIGLAETILEWTGAALIEGQLEEFLLGTNRFEGGLANLFELQRYPWHEPVDEHRRPFGGIGAKQRLRNPASEDYSLHAAPMFELELQDDGVGDKFGLADQVEDINASASL